MNWTTIAEEFSGGLLAPEAPAPNFVSGARRYGVYRNNVTVGLIRALESNFPVVRTLLGEKYFAGLAGEFARQYPPTSPLMFLYGAELPTYLMTQDDLKEFPYLHDVGQLEILTRQSYHEADAPVANASIFTGLDEEALMRLTLKPHPALRMLTSPYAIVSITKVNRGEDDMKCINPSLPETVLITRPELEVRLQKLSPPEHAMIAQLVAGQELGVALDTAFATDSEFDMTLAMQRIITSGAFTI